MFLYASPPLCFSDETAARKWFEATWWPDGPVCPRCGSLKHYTIKKEGDFAVTFKRYMRGACQHRFEKHMNRYLA
ncbi:MAG TPA: transposase [Rhizomicrobium sp.]